jgi:hypothetical protein
MSRPEANPRGLMTKAETIKTECPRLAGLEPSLKGLMAREEPTLG